MVIVFAVGFAFLGVGSGGLDLASLVQSVFGKGSSGTSVSKARKNVAKHPNDPHAYKLLADALQTKGRTAEEISALEHYMKLAPKDTTQLQRLAQVEVQQASGAQQAEAVSRNAQSSVALTAFFTPQLGGTDPLTNALQSQVSKQAQDATSAYGADVQRAIGTLEKLAALQKDVPSYTQLATVAEQFGENTAAIAGYTHLLKLETDPATKAQIRSRIKALRKAPSTTGG